MTKVDLTKVDLTLVKKLIEEMETQLNAAYESKKQPDINLYIIDMSKAAGLAAGILQEAGLIVGDIQTLTLKAQGGMPASKPSSNDFLDKILAPLKNDKN